MNIISQFHQFLGNSFHSFLEKYFLESNFWHKSSDFNNYINFMNDLDSFNYSFITNVIKNYFEYIDEEFFILPIVNNFVSQKVSIKELFLLYLVKLLLNEDTTMIKNIMIGLILLIFF